MSNEKFNKKTNKVTIYKSKEYHIYILIAGKFTSIRCFYNRGNGKGTSDFPLTHMNDKEWKIIPLEGEQLKIEGIPEGRPSERYRFIIDNIDIFYTVRYLSKFFTDQMKAEKEEEKKSFPETDEAETFTDLDTIWKKNNGKPFFVKIKDDIFNRVMAVTYRTSSKDLDYAPNLYIVDSRYICRRDIERKIWKQTTYKGI